MVYDYAMRPLSQQNSDKSEITWDYSDPGKTKISYKSQEGYEFDISRTNDNQSEVINHPDGNTVASQYDSRGNLVSLNENGKQVVKQDYYNDGRLRSSTYETFNIVPEYDDYDETSGIHISDADPEKASRNWQNTQYDENGNVKTITGLQRLPATKYLRCRWKP
jgi:YD repeat-containing protein